MEHLVFLWTIEQDAWVVQQDCRLQIEVLVVYFEMLLDLGPVGVGRRALTAERSQSYSRQVVESTLYQHFFNFIFNS